MSEIEDAWKDKFIRMANVAYSARLEMETNELEAEIERLREALHKVLGIVGNFPVDRFEYNIIKEARAALGEKEP